jgi:hypothetical protein
MKYSSLLAAASLSSASAATYFPMKQWNMNMKRGAPVTQHVVFNGFAPSTLPSHSTADDYARDIGSNLYFIHDCSAIDCSPPPTGYNAAYFKAFAYDSQYEVYIKSLEDNSNGKGWHYFYDGMADTCSKSYQTYNIPPSLCKSECDNDGGCDMYVITPASSSCDLVSWSTCECRDGGPKMNSFAAIDLNALSSGAAVDSAVVSAPILLRGSQ